MFSACGFAMPWFYQVRVAAMLLWFVVCVACAGSWFECCCLLLLKSDIAVGGACGVCHPVGVVGGGSVHHCWTGSKRHWGPNDHAVL
jgi:hypothetical protein